MPRQAESIGFTLGRRCDPSFAPGMFPLIIRETDKKKIRKSSQGTRTVEEYFEKFESLKNKLKIREPDETLMAQFLDGLQDCIARKVERQP